MVGWGKKQNTGNNQRGLPKFVKDRRNQTAREEERQASNTRRIFGKATNQQGNKKTR